MPRTNSASGPAAALAAVVALAVAFALLGVPVALLTLPPYTRIAESRLVPAAETGLPRATQLAAAESVRRFIAENDAPALPSTLEGRPAFDAAAVSHLLDVRRVVVAARGYTALALVVLAAAALAMRRRAPRALGTGLVAGAALLVALVAFAFVWAAVDFEAFFAAFHGLFFRAGTWMFPADSLLIELFPERFWMTAGAAWATLTAVLAAATAFLGVRLRRRG